MDMISDLSFSKFAIFSGYSIFSFSSTNSIGTEKRDYNTEIPLSSVYGKIPIVPEILYSITTVPDLDDVEILNFIEIHNTLEPKYFIAAIIQSAY
jgi:hypothetical protein